jgi:hypothetical protein
LLVTLRDPEAASRVRSELRALLSGPFEIVTWYDENRQLLEAVLVEKNVMYYLLFFIVLVAAFGIVSALITFVVSKIAVGIFAGGVVFATLLPEIHLHLGSLEINSFWIGSVAVIGADGNDDAGNEAGSAYVYRWNEETSEEDPEALL